MSALSIQSEPPPADQSTFGTKDPILVATLGNFGFAARYSLPVMLVVSSANVINMVDRNSGRIEDCAHLEFRMEAEILDPMFGRLSAQDVELAHNIAKLAQKEQTGELSGAEALKLQNMRAKWGSVQIVNLGHNHSGAILWAVQKFYDQITNFMVVASVTKELAKNPMIEFSKQLYKGVAYAVEPCETEPQAQRRSEKLFRK